MGSSKQLIGFGKDFDTLYIRLERAWRAGGGLLQGLGLKMTWKLREATRRQRIAVV